MNALLCNGLHRDCTLVSRRKGREKKFPNLLSGRIILCIKVFLLMIGRLPNLHFIDRSQCHSICSTFAGRLLLWLKLGVVIRESKTMGSQQEFVDYVIGQIDNAGVITAKAMFGGYHVYSDGKLFALIIDNKLFVKITVSGAEFAKGVTQVPAFPKRLKCCIDRLKPPGVLFISGTSSIFLI
jgi:hypothetical protein